MVKQVQTQLRSVLGTLIMLVMVLALVVNLSVPTPALAKEQPTLGSLFSFFTEVLAEDGPTFPVAGEVEPVREVWVIATAYSSDVWQTDATPCIPAMDSFDLCQHYDEYGIADTIAANFLPLGTRVVFDAPEVQEILAGQTYVVRDRMNAKYNGTHRIDIWMPTYEAAKNFGVKRFKMQVYPQR